MASQVFSKYGNHFETIYLIIKEDQSAQEEEEKMGLFCIMTARMTMGLSSRLCHGAV